MVEVDFRVDLWQYRICELPQGLIQITYAGYFDQSAKSAQFTLYAGQFEIIYVGRVVYSKYSQATNSNIVVIEALAPVRVQV